MPRIVKSVYLDTNVFVEAAFAGTLHPTSALVVDLAIARRIGAFGSTLLLQEIRRVCRRRASQIPLRLYDAAMSDFVPTGKHAKHLGRA